MRKASRSGRQRGKVLVMAPHPVYSPRGAPLCVYYRTLALVEAGLEIDLLTYGEGQDVALPGVRMLRTPRLPGGVKVGPSLGKILLDLYIFVRAAILAVRHHYEFVHAHEESVFIALLLRPILRTKIVYDMHSCLPHLLEISSHPAVRPWLVRVFEWLENQALSRVDAVITPCPELLRYAAGRTADPERVFCVENSLFEAVRVGGAGDRAASESGIPDLPRDRRLIVYAGTFEHYQGLDLLVRAFGSVRERVEDAFLVIVGGLPEQVDRLRSLARDLGVEEDCLFTGRLPQRQARHCTERAAVLVSPRREGFNTPMKLFALLASGIAVVATRIPAHTQIVDDASCILVHPTPDDLAEGIARALEDPERRRKVVEGAKALYGARYSPDAYRAKMRRVVDLLCPPTCSSRHA